MLLWLGKYMGLLYYYLAKRQRQRAVAQMRESMGNSKAEAEALIRQSFINIGCNFLEVMYMVILGPVGIVTGAFVQGHNIDLPAGTEMYIQTKADIELYGIQTAAK